jgi:ATP-dependent Clp protease adaptor protein ClpS
LESRSAYSTTSIAQEIVMADDQTGTVTVEEPQVQTPPREEVDKKKKPKRQPPYHVILWNDDDHTYQYVINMMQKLFGHPVEKGMQIADEVDKRGKAVVMTTTRELAELKRDQIHAFGKDDLIAGCKGSMSSTIEPSE